MREGRHPAQRNETPSAVCITLVKFSNLGTRKLGIVLLESIVSNSGYAHVRYWILKKCQMLASVCLPVETFYPAPATK